MSLRDKLLKSSGVGATPSFYTKFGILENPFPASSQPTGHPHLESDVDDQIVNAIKQFEAYNHATQVIVVEGTQGVGKTNLLNYYQHELQDYYRDEKGFYIIRYYPDPEPSFDAIVRKIFQELGENHLRQIGEELSERNEAEAERIIGLARSSDVRAVLYTLRRVAKEESSELGQVCEAALEWFLGLRLYKKHSQLLGVFFRLDTVESKTQALRDIVYVSSELTLLNGIFLLLDELEKQDYSLSKTTILKYLSAIRALIDSLPRNLFMMLALTPSARNRYFLMLPAIAGRLQNIVTLKPLQKDDDAVNLYRFYLSHERQRTKNEAVTGETPGSAHLLTEEIVKDLFNRMLVESANRGVKGVTHRDLLQRLRDEAEAVIANG
ncbi:AAA family ATPase [Geomesophilobacter sediminis]|uniref:ORC1/DEAH AAA+ ATPase domain-containing protein n=1 Tax=Geomesophilobacter sediminis TaxID=2798584 RepID=A0A8J7JED9_9BACT|nr:AAA family ATPase [Geomesophilobacter sediminis]MBJ6724389.1 hypothetical protein [Geomesophilobacter sediminis]